MNIKTTVVSFVGVFLLQLLTPSYAEVSQVPLFLSTSVDPNVLIDMSVEVPMGGAAYNDQDNTDPNHPAYDVNDLCNGRGGPDSDGRSAGICYNPKKKYLGIYNPFKCYTQSADDGYFVIDSSTQGDSDLPDTNGYYQDTTFQCSGQWSGNVLNWSTMTAMDIFSVVMTGGNRAVDTTTSTILEAARRYTSRGWFPTKIIGSEWNVQPSTVTPFSADRVEIKAKWVGGTMSPYQFSVRVQDSGEHFDPSKTTPTEVKIKSPFNSLCMKRKNDLVQRVHVHDSDGADHYHKSQLTFDNCSDNINQKFDLIPLGNNQYTIKDKNDQCVRLINDDTETSYGFKMSGNCSSTDNPSIFKLNKVNGDIYKIQSKLSSTESVYEDAEDGGVDGWVVYDNDPEGGQISNIEDPEKGHVIQFDGAATSNGYRLGNYNSGWVNGILKKVKWSMKYSESYVVYISTSTSKGHRYIYYTAADSDYGLSGEYIHHGLGAASRDGTWKTFTRDIGADLQEFEPDNNITTVNGIYIRGSGRVDDIKLNGTPYCFHADNHEDVDDEIVHWECGDNTNARTNWLIVPTGEATDDLYHYNSKVKVCDLASGLEDNCVRYGNNTYKPEGLIQRNSERMRFGVMAYSKENSNDRDGGVLRADIGYLGLSKPDGTDNTEKAFSSNGIYRDSPVSFNANDLVRQNPSYSGVINYINKFHKGGYKGYDPVSELYYEAIRYFKNGEYSSVNKGPTPEYIAGLENIDDDFPIIKNWKDPIQYSCQKNFIIGINDAYPWKDKTLPGTFFTNPTFTSTDNQTGVDISDDYGEPSHADSTIDVTELTNQVGDLEGLTGTQQCVGCTAEECQAANWNQNAQITSEKTLTKLGEVFGTCPAGSRHNSYYIAGLAYYANTTDLRTDTDMPGKQTVSTFMIDTQEYNANPLTGRMNMLWLAGKYGGFIDENDNNEPDLVSEWDGDGDGQPDNYVLANDPQKMIIAFERAFTDIKARVASSSSAAANTSQLSTNAKVYQARFDSKDWSGNLFAYNLETTNNSGAIKDRLWDASEKIPVHTSRKIYTYNPALVSANKGIEFKWNSLSDVQKVLLNKDINGLPDALGETRLDWLRGDQSLERNKGGALRDRTNLLGDIVHSDPKYAGTYENYGYSTLPTEGGTYQNFIASKANRTASVYFGANDGMLHSINAETGNELFSYVPSYLLNEMSKLPSPLYGCNETGCSPHQYFVDGSPATGDVYFSSDTTWRTVLLGTLGAGGKGLFALDVTNPETFSATNVLWEISTTQAPHDAATFADHLGYTIPPSSIVRMHNGKWAAIVSNGYESANKEATLFVIDIETGEIIKTFETGVGSVAHPNGLSTAIPVDINTDRIVDYIYAGDLQGNLWKFDVTSSNVNEWSIPYATNNGDADPFFKACLSNNDCQAITAKPQVGRSPAGGVMIYIGTGKYFEASDENIGNSPQVQTFYALRDDLTSSGQVSGRSDLIEQSILAQGVFPSSEYNYRLTSSHTVDYTSNDGWYMDLKSPDVSGNFVAKGERVIAGALLRDDRIVFVTMQPDVNPCSYGGKSWLMEVNAINGSKPAKPVLDIDTDGNFSSADNVTVTKDDGTTESVVISGMQQPDLGIIFKSPVVMDHFDSEGKYLNSSSGSLHMIKEARTAPAGRQSWRQLQ